MQLNTHTIELIWSNELPVEQLRPFLLGEINNLGFPLRWAVTSIRPSSSGDFRQIILEAVVIQRET